jgi:hypothetical protein
MAPSNEFTTSLASVAFRSACFRESSLEMARHHKRPFKAGLQNEGSGGDCGGGGDDDDGDGGLLLRSC